MPTIAHRSRPKDGEQANGDAVVRRQEGERTLLAVVDGLGHGELAALAATRAVDYLRGWALDGDLLAAMHGVHEVLRGTRGAAASLCLLHGQALVCCGVGNVEIRCLGTKVPILPSPGVLGARVLQFRICRGALAPGSRLVLFSDGISQRSPLEALRRLDPEALCDELMLHHRKPTDDATVLVCDLEA
jgi:negative regulator of sigma-B (phosphoserine phosphatase)